MRINQLTNANVYVDGISLLGQVEEINVPELKSKMVDINALGMWGMPTFASGFEKLEGSLKWTAFYPEAIRKAGNFLAPVQLMIRGNVMEQTPAGIASQKNLTITLTATFNSWPGGNFKRGDNVEFTTNFTATAIKVTFDGNTELEVDVLANVYKVNGVDQLAQFNANQ